MLPGLTACVGSYADCTAQNDAAGGNSGLNPELWQGFKEITGTAAIMDLARSYSDGVGPLDGITPGKRVIPFM